MGKLIKVVSAGLVFAVAASVCSCQMFGGVDKSRKGKGARQTDVTKTEYGVSPVTVVNPVPTDPVQTDPTTTTETSGGNVNTGVPSGIPDRNDYNTEFEALLALCYAVQGNDMKTAESMMNEYFGTFLVVSDSSDFSYDTRYYDIDVNVEGINFTRLSMSASQESGKVFQINISAYYDETQPGLDAYDIFYKQLVSRYGDAMTEMNEEDFNYSFYSIDYACSCNINVYYVDDYSSFTFDFDNYSLIY